MEKVLVKSLFRNSEKFIDKVNRNFRLAQENKSSKRIWVYRVK